MDELAYQICEIAQRAGAKIKEIRRSCANDEIQIKDDGSPVTIADLSANKIIAEGLRLLEPQWPIVSEEGSEGGDARTSKYSFLVDPLDGTKEFIKGRDMYTVNIAIMELNKNLRWNPIFGVVHAPELCKTWIGGTSVPAIRQDADGIRKISCGGNRLKPIIVGSMSHSSPLDRQFAEAIGDHTFLGVGSSIKICKVADGSADMSPRFGTTSCWDTAAAHAILNASGGQLLGPEGVELDYDIHGEILNPWFLATSGNLGLEQWKMYQEN